MLLPVRTAKPLMSYVDGVSYNVKKQKKTTTFILYSIPLFDNLTSKLSKFNADRWSLMIVSSFLTRVSSLIPAPVDIAAIRCNEGPGRHQIADFNRPNQTCQYLPYLNATLYESSPVLGE